MENQITIKENPIYQLGKSVIEGEFSLANACGIAASRDFTENMNELHCQSILSFIPEVFRTDPPSAKIYSQLNTICANSVNVAIDLKAAIWDIHASVLQAMDEHDESLEYFGIARQFYVEFEENRAVAHCDISMGDSYKSLGNFEKAIDHYRSARLIFARERMEDETKMCEQCIYEITQRLTSSNMVLNIDLVLSEEILDRRFQDVLNESYMPLGDACHEISRWEDSLRLYYGAMQDFERRGMMRHAAKSIKHVVMCYNQLGRHEEAIALISSTREIFEQENLILDLAQFDYLAVGSYVARGDMENAIYHYLAAKHIFEQEGIVENVALCEIKLALSYLRVESFNEAMQHYLAAEASLAGDKISKWLSLFERGLRNFPMNPGDIDAALRQCFAARDVFTEDEAKCDREIFDTMIALLLTKSESNGSPGRIDQ